jgi:tRNA (cmo5U34)-methyltransferase
MEMFARKSTPEEIRARFDNDVERFSKLEVGQNVAIDSVLCLELVAKAAARCTPHARRVLDIGCGAGNFTIRLKHELDFSEVTFVDLSAPMLTRAAERAAELGLQVETIQTDMRLLELPEESCDVILAGATLHHLRGDEEWELMFRKMVAALKPFGSLWIFDLISHEIPAVHSVQWHRYRDYLLTLGDEDFVRKIFGYIEQEDTPRPVTYQLDLLRRSGLSHVDILHKNAAFAALGGVKLPQ